MKKMMSATTKIMNSKRHSAPSALNKTNEGGTTRMKLKFKNQAFQTDAVNSVVDLFTGQDKRQSAFNFDHSVQISLLQNDFGIGNALLLDDAALLANMHEVQKRNHLPLTDDLANKRFCIEMETGTGKTYVYTKTIFELHKRYGFTKFIIVVPSVAIREGVYKSLEINKGALRRPVRQRSLPVFYL